MTATFFTHRPSATAHCTAELVITVCKLVITLARTFIGYRRLVILLQLISMLTILFIYLERPPYLEHWVNHIRVGLASALTFLCLMDILLVYAPAVHGPMQHQQFYDALTWFTFPALIPVALLGSAYSYWRLYNFWADVCMAFDSAEEIDLTGVHIKDVYDFISPFEVELAARTCRQWAADGRTRDKHAMTRAEHIIKAGVALFSKDPYMMIIQAAFLMDGLGMYQVSTHQLSAAAKQDPDIVCRYIMFSRQQDTTRHTTTTEGQDLVSYVEYKRRYNTVVRHHKNSLQAISSFWSLLQSHHVSFTQLSHHLTQIDDTVRHAELQYHAVLEMYNNDSRLLRMYAKFLETVKNDAASASVFYAEAIKQDEANGDNNGDDRDMLQRILKRGGIASDMLGNALDERTSVAMVSNAAGTIQATSKQVVSVLGYKKGELMGKNLAIIMPNPWSNKHSSYLRNYLSRGGDKVTLNARQVVALNRDGHGLPIRIALAKASGMGEDSIFLGLLEPIRVRPNISLIWVQRTGTICCVDMAFSAMFGYHADELVNTRFAQILTPNDANDGRGEEDVNYDDAALEALANEILRLNVQVEGGGGGAGGGGGGPNGAASTTATVGITAKMQQQQMARSSSIAAPSAAGGGSGNGNVGSYPNKGSNGNNNGNYNNGSNGNNNNGNNNGN
eukprot:CAMPEP_0175046066 /NCGR_PEP_ID=MMETSP0052_2-20121109/4815_1 /TAXON_ID=51329 ORGANISM="Polytomella parva, Strain SAG 63-3" /NCGR_SAMPLE_ID=MMETSP0052_2 /ASSEMBLY_ACC=CAM_ASM_000194 /LENGTH=674 /DNA_ID=CAMNT_0016309753 /DNA_START=773 /DNA_END=2794 /DNA_ORIENTATION=-